MTTKEKVYRLCYLFFPAWLDVRLRKIIDYWTNPIWKEYRKNKPRLFEKNIKFKDIHKGKRCFIVCNGPSIAQQDLTKLKNEIVFSVSQGYHHKDYKIYKPRYHCIPQVTYGKVTHEDVIRWFQEMDEEIGEAELFLNYTEDSLVAKNNLFSAREVNYVCLGSQFGKDFDNTGMPDITDIIPGVRSVPIMCLMIALYMGFSEIYLLGVEHDPFRKNEYKYFFDKGILQDKQKEVSSTGEITTPMYYILKNQAELRAQYRAIKAIADHHKIKIFNATDGGALDEFPRVKFEELF